MFDEIAEAKGIFWENFQGTGMSYEVFEVLFDSAIDKLKRNLTSQSNGRDNAYHCPNCGRDLRAPHCPNCGMPRR